LQREGGKKETNGTKNIPKSVVRRKTKKSARRGARSTIPLSLEERALYLIHIHKEVKELKKEGEGKGKRGVTGREVALGGEGCWVGREEKREMKEEEKRENGGREGMGEYEKKGGG